MLVIVTWLWTGWRPVYSAEHVNKLGRMLKKHMSIPFRFVCITDNPKGIEGETFPLWSQEPAKLTSSGLVDARSPVPNCFVRLRAFDDRVNKWFGADKILSIDLDCVVLNDMAPLITNDSFKAAKGLHSHVCGTLWQLTPGAHQEVWDEYDPIKTPKLISEVKYGDRIISGSDQAWMSIKMPQAPTWGPEDGVYWFPEIRTRKIPSNARVVYFAGSTKPWTRDCEMMSPALYKEYAAA